MGNSIGNRGDALMVGTLVRGVVVATLALVALLAAPFMLFEAPSTLPDAVIVSRSAPLTMPQPAPAATDEHAAPADGR